MAVPLTLLPIQTAPSMIPQQQQQQTPHSPNSRPSTADSMKSPVSASAATAAQEKRKTSRRANTAERRATHNAVERQRRETLNGRFLDLASLLPNLNSVRRPSKSAIVNSSIALIHQQRRQKSLAALELRALYTQFLALKAEADEWRARAGVGCVEEGERSREFWEMVRDGEEVLNGNGGGSEKEAMRRVREVGEEESRARVLAEAASSTSHGARREDDDEDGLLGEEDLVAAPSAPPAAPIVVSAPEPTAVPNAAHLAHQQHLAQVHAQAQAQIHAAQQVQQQQQQQAQMLMRARAATLSSIQVPQAQFAHQVPQQQQTYHHHQQQQQQQQQYYQQQPQIPFDSGAELYSVADLYAYQAQVQQPLKTEVMGGWPAAPAPTTFMLPSPPMFNDDSSSSSSASGSPSPHLGRSRAGSLNNGLVQVPVPVAAGFY